MTEEEYDRVMRINVKSIYHSTKSVVPHFRKQDHGVFVNISSISASRPRPNLVWYAGSKGAVSAVSNDSCSFVFGWVESGVKLILRCVQVTKGLAAEYAAENIRCNAVLPVAGDTAMYVYTTPFTSIPHRELM